MDMRFRREGDVRHWEFEIGVSKVKTAPRPFDIKEISEDSVTVERCRYMFGVIYKNQAGDLSASFPSKSECVLCAKVDTRDGALTLDFEPDTEAPPVESPYVHIPLYEFSKSDSEMWYVSCDVRPGVVVIQV